MSPFAHLLRAAVQGYRFLISPVIGPACRFAPSCSEYALEAIAVHGAVKGGALATKRVLRCHPWGGSGYDPVPESACRCPAPHKASLVP